MKNRYLLSFMAFFLCISPLFSQDEEDSSPVTISGSIDAYFRANLGAPNKVNPAAPGTSFANRPGFALGMANLVIAKKEKKQDLSLTWSLAHVVKMPYLDPP